MQLTAANLLKNQEIHALRSLKFKKKETAPDGIPFMCGLFCFKLS